MPDRNTWVQDSSPPSPLLLLLSPPPPPSPLDSPRDLAHSLSRAAGPSGEILKGWLALPPDLCSPYLAAAWNGRLLCMPSCPVEAESSRKCPTSLSLLKHSSWHVMGAQECLVRAASLPPFLLLSWLCCLRKHRLGREPQSSPVSPLQQRPLRSGKVNEQAQRSRAAAESGCGGEHWQGVLCSLSYIKQ